jgi:hypothetical protein
MGHEEDYPDLDAAVISILSSPIPLSLSVQSTPALPPLSLSPSIQSVPALPPHLIAQAIRLRLIRGTPSAPHFLLARTTQEVTTYRKDSTYHFRLSPSPQDPEDSIKSDRHTGLTTKRLRALLYHYNTKQDSLSLTPIDRKGKGKEPTTTDPTVIQHAYKSIPILYVLNIHTKQELDRTINKGTCTANALNIVYVLLSDIDCTTLPKVARHSIETTLAAVTYNQCTIGDISL